MSDVRPIDANALKNRVITSLNLGDFGINEQSEDNAKVFEQIIDNAPTIEPNVAKAQVNKVYKYLKEHLGKIVDDMDEFEAWFERMAWHVRECDRLTLELSEAKPKQGEWTPCEERLPDIGEWVLVTIYDCEYPIRQAKRVNLFNRGTTAWCVETITAYLKNEDVFAWMPLPQPYEAEKMPWELINCKKIHRDSVYCMRYPACENCEEREER